MTAPSSLRCQSCAMPLGPGFFGTTADGTETQEYCKFCYQDGAFTRPDQTLEEMIQSSVGYMISTGKYTQDQAEELSQAVIPGLRRWKQ